MPKTEMKNRQEMANFMPNDDVHNTTNCDGKTLLLGACSAPACPLLSLFATHNNIIKDVQISENSSQKGQKFSDKITLDVDVQDQDNNMQSNGNTSLPDAPWSSWQQPLWLNKALPIILSMKVLNQRMLVDKARALSGKSNKSRSTPYPRMLLIWKPCLLLHFPTTCC